MKNKLLKIGVLALILSASFYFFSNSEQEFQKESKKEEVKSVDTNSKLNVADKKETIVNQPSKTNIQLDLRKSQTVNLSQSIQEEKVQKLSKRELDSIDQIREKYQQFIVNHPFRERMKLPKAQRKAMGLPPNAFNEQEWLYTADPNLGRPTPEVVLDLQKTLDRQLEEGRVPGDGLDNQWVERGPNNVGGRTRVLQFAPGSTTKVFAGAVSGGLWVNNDITNATSSWTQVSGVPSNMAVTCMTIDPQNSNIMYIGTGEVYTWGAVNGNGVYKSIDGGVTWRLIFGTSIGAGIADQLTYIQDIIAWVNPSTGLTEIYFGADAMFYSEAVGATQWLGVNTIGLWKSTDGLNFAKFTNVALQTTATTYCAPNTFTIDANGDLFMGTKRSAYGTGGGRIYKCTNGTNWTLVRTLTANGRVQLVASKTTVGRMYALCENYATGLPVIRRSTDAFATVDTNVPLPVSSGNQPPPATDFCRDQAFYDLMIGMNPTNDSEVYVGGIEIFKNTNAFKASPVAGDWTQLTDWTVNPTANGNATANSLDGVHSDHHVMAFCPSQTSRVVFGCDGGVYYSNNSGTSIGERNKDYNVTQVYKGSIDQSTAGNKMLGGLQDNGSQLVSNPATTGAGNEVYGGDGCWEFIDKQQQYMVVSYVYNTYIYCTYAGVATAYIANDNGGSDGDFVNQCGLDSNSNILYANGTSGTTYRIYRYAINPSTGATTTTTLTDASINAIPTYFEPSPYTTNRIMVGLSNGRLIRMNSANAATPTYVTLTTPFTGAISDIKYGNSENDLFVTIHNYGVTSVWYSADGGANWANKEGDLPNIPVKCILQNPNATNEVIIGTELGIWYTVNFNAATPTWRRANAGMKDCKVLSLDYRAADKTILAATFGRGMWTGQFWQCGDLTTSWNGSTWSNGAPTSKTAVTFAGNYTSTASLDACSVTVNTGANVVFNSGHSLRVGENITVNGTGTLTFENNSALVQYTKHAVNTGNITVKRNSANMIRQDYTAWGSPVSGQNLLAFSPNTLTNRFYQYLFTGTTTPTAYQSLDPSTNSFQTAKGYMIRVANNWTSIAPGTSFLGQFTGVPNNGSITFAVGQGYNLLSNPYASPINAKTFMINNPKVDALYYWTHTVPASGGTYPSNNYASYTILGGTASANGSAIPNDYIQVGQGFFVQANSAFNVNFENEYRVDAALSTQFFRLQNTVQNVSETEKHRIWLNLNSSTNAHNQILVGYMNGATAGFDKKIDALALETSKSMIYNIIDDKEYVIQGRSLPFDENDIVPIGFKATENSSFEIEINSFDGLFENQEVYLKDNFIGAIHNLKEGKYFFLSQIGDFKNRFELVFKKPSVSQEIIVDNQVFVFVNAGKINLTSSDKNIQSFEIYDVLGKQIVSKNNINNKEYVVSGLTSSNQSLIVRLVLEDGRQITKKVVF